MLRHILAASTALMAVSTWGQPATAAVAVSLAPAAIGTECTSNNPLQTVDNPSHCQVQGAQATAQATPYVLLQAQLTEGGFVATESATASLSYQFEVVGGTPGTAVPVSIAAILTAMSTANYSAYARMTTDYTDTYVCAGVPALSNCTTNSFNGAVQLNVQSGTPVNISLISVVGGSYYSAGSAYASADPYISVSRAFDPAGIYSIQVSPGVANALAAVPEPAAWVMMIAGLGMIGTVGRRRSAGLLRV